MKQRLLIMMICLLITMGLSSQSKSIRQQINEAGTSSKYPNSPYVTIFDSINVKVEETGLCRVKEHRLLKVLTDKGAKDLTVYKYDYDPLSAYCKIESVRIYKVNGSIVDLDMTKVMDYAAPARMIYWGARQVMVEIGRLEIGDAIEITLSKKGFTYALLMQNSNDNEEQYIPPMRGHYYDFVPFYNTIPVNSKVYMLTIPRSKELQFKTFNGELSVSKIYTEKENKYTFSKQDIKPYQRQANMVAPNDVFTKLILTTSEKWEDKSKWFYKVNEDYGSFKSTKDIDAKVAEILKNATNEMDSISLLTHWAADEIRYSGLSIGKGEGYTLHTGEMDFIDRAGVCKDKAGMLITMLRAAGFESYAAMTMAGEYIEDMPADHFNHSVVAVKLRNGEMMMLDPTWVPFTRELWSSREQQQGYLIGTKEGSTLQYTPISSPDNHYLRIICNSKILDNGTLEVEFRLRADGQLDAAVRRLFSGSGDDDFYRKLELEFKKIAPNAIIDKLDYTNPNNYLKEAVSIFAKLTIPNYAFSNGSSIILNPITNSPAFKSAFMANSLNTGIETREHGFVIGCSQKIEITETMEFPDGFKLVNKEILKPNINVSSPSASFTGSVTNITKKIIANHVLTLNKRVYQAEEWTSVKEAVDKQKEILNTTIIIEKQK